MGARRPKCRPDGAAGRPSRAAAALLGERILDAATELLLAEGYGSTSIEAVAQRARISKRTFYHRFPDKAALFGAVVHRIVEQLRSPAGTPLYEGGNLEDVLRRLARLLLRATLMPMALSLNPSSPVAARASGIEAPNLTTRIRWFSPAFPAEPSAAAVLVSAIVHGGFMFGIGIP